MPRSELVLRPSRLKWLGMLGICLLFVAVGRWELRDGAGVLGWLTIAFFGLGIGVSLVQFIPNSAYLKLTEDGFQSRTMFRTYALSWADVDHFEAYRMRTSSFVGIVYAPTFKPSNASRALMGVSRRMAGVDGGLSDTYGMSADELAALMNRWLSEQRDAHG